MKSVCAAVLVGWWSPYSIIIIFYIQIVKFNLERTNIQFRCTELHDNNLEVFIVCVVGWWTTISNLFFLLEVFIITAQGQPLQQHFCHQQIFTCSAIIFWCLIHNIHIFLLQINEINIFVHLLFNYLKINIFIATNFSGDVRACKDRGYLMFKQQPNEHFYVNLGCFSQWSTSFSIISANARPVPVSRDVS